MTTDPKTGITFKNVKLTAEQEGKWLNTRTMFMWRAPGFDHVMKSMLCPDDQYGQVLYWTDDIPTLATDGERILANPEFFFNLSIKQRVAAMAHEVIHGILDHCGTGARLNERGTITTATGKTLPYDPDQGNVAMDYIVNDMIDKSRIGELSKDWLHDPKIATQDDTWADTYAKIYKKRPKSSGGSSGGNGPPKTQDQHMAPGTSTGKSSQQAQQQRQQIDMAWRSAMSQAAAITRESMGQGTDALNQYKFFEDKLQPTVSWQDKITGIMSRKIGSGSYDYSKADRRLIVRNIFAPGRSGHGCGTIVVAIDSSGSIYGVPKLIDRFFAEMTGILCDLRPKKIVVIWCDAQIQEVIEIEDEMDLAECYRRGAKGGGGTCFKPPFEWVEKEGIADAVDGLVYLTDLMGSFPNEEPSYPVIWCTIEPGKVPWGDYVEIPADGSA